MSAFTLPEWLKLRPSWRLEVLADSPDLLCGIAPELRVEHPDQVHDYMRIQHAFATAPIADVVLSSLRGAFIIASLYIGGRLGYYDALAERTHTSTSLARATQSHERYAREWLEQQAVAGIVCVVDEWADTLHRQYYLPQASVDALTNQLSLQYILPFSRVFMGCLRPIDKVVHAYKTGEGVPFEDYGVDMRQGIAQAGRPASLLRLGPEWIPMMPDVAAVLAQGGRVADMGCGEGWSSIGVAKSFPHVTVDGFDLDEASIAGARMNAKEAGVDDRVTFQVKDAGAVEFHGQYNLVLLLQCLHDMSDPVGALNTARKLLCKGGTILVADERVGERFSTVDTGVDWMMYGWSILHCLPACMVEQPSVATGTVMRPDTLRLYAHRAGLSHVEVLPIESFVFRFYRLHP